MKGVFGCVRGWGKSNLMIVRVPTTTTHARIEALLGSLDYAALGPIYCDSGGDAFWQAHRGPVLELGMRWATEAGARFSPGGRSLYVGAGVAELPVMVTEVLDLERRCVAANLRRAECDVLDAALRAAGLDERLRLHCGSAVDLVDAGFDHLAVVNVLDDPQTYPAVSEVTYGLASALDLDVEAFVRERAAVRRLVATLCDALCLPGWITTTFEEAPWFLEWASQHGAGVGSDECMLETALVGDPIGFLRVEPGVRR